VSERRALVSGRWLRWIMALCLAAVLGLSAGSVQASTDRGLVYRCRLVSTKLGEEITLSFRLRTNAPRQVWRVRLYHEGERVFSKLRRTNGVGNLRVVRVVPNVPGRDEVAARARHRASGTLCDVAFRA
jgi:hypothetical protein